MSIVEDENLRCLLGFADYQQQLIDFLGGSQMVYDHWKDCGYDVLKARLALHYATEMMERNLGFAERDSLSINCKLLDMAELTIANIKEREADNNA